MRKRKAGAPVGPPLKKPKLSKKTSKKKRKKPVPITHSKGKTDPRSAIHAYHNLRKQNGAEDNSDSDMDMSALRRYQDASIHGHTKRSANNTTAKWVVTQLMALHRIGKNKPKLSLLDVGAITNHYVKHQNDFDICAIDLNPRHPTVMRMDFFELPLDTKYDVIVLSLVVNFIGEKKKRADMIKRCAELLNPDGFLFIVLPLACVDNSRYLDTDTYDHALAAIGFEHAGRKQSKKLDFSMFCLRANSKVDDDDDILTWCGRRVLKTGKSRNNFALCFS